jgi:hypothetical protein
MKLLKETENLNIYKVNFDSYKIIGKTFKKISMEEKVIAIKEIIDLHPDRQIMFEYIKQRKWFVKALVKRKKI